MAAISILNPKAETVRNSQVLSFSVAAARGLAEIVRTNLGPRGTMKMLVDGAGSIQITKDGQILLQGMQIKHPISSFIAKATTAVDASCGDGTTSMVILVAEFLRLAEQFVSVGVHPRTIHEGMRRARNAALEIIDKFKIPIAAEKLSLMPLVKTCLLTKLEPDVARNLSEICVDAVLSVYDPKEPLDIDQIEIMTMEMKLQGDTKLVKGLVLDHGGRHPCMPQKLKNAYILTCNVSLEFENTEIHSGFYYKSAEEREKFVEAERQFIDRRVKQIIELKEKLCAGSDKGFVVINQKGIDPLSLEALSKSGIMALRRAKRKNMDRLTRACGGYPMNSFDELTEKCLGFAGLVYEQVLGETKYTFVTDCAYKRSVTVLIHGPAQYALNQMKDAVKDGLNCLRNAIEDGCVVAGAGAIEMNIRNELLQREDDEFRGRSRAGLKVFTEGLLAVPRTLAENSGLDVEDALALVESQSKGGQSIGLDVGTGRPIHSVCEGILDNYQVKKNCISTSSLMALQLLLVDEVMRAGLTKL